MADTADVVVIGGGIVGTSVACHLAEGGAGRVVLLEREPILGSCSTGKSVGGVRCQFSCELNVRMSQLSTEMFLELADETGVELEFRRHGYLTLATTKSGKTEEQETLALLRTVGVRAEEMTRSEVGELLPGLNVDDVEFALYTPDDGWLDPHAVVQGYARKGRAAGVTTRFNCAVQSVKVSGGRVVGAVTSSGGISTRTVIDAAGPWAAQVAATAGASLPAVPHKRHIFVTAGPGRLARETPLVIVKSPAFYFRPEGSGVLMSAADKTPRPDCDTNVDYWHAMETLAETVEYRYPELLSQPIETVWAGLRTLTSDQNAIVGESPEIEGLFFAAGFSGHGVMHAPITGKLVAELVMDGKARSLDITALSPERFTGETRQVERQVI